MTNYLKFIALYRCLCLLSELALGSGLEHHMDSFDSLCGMDAKCKTCTAENSKWKSDCSLLVSIECSYVDNGVKKSCFSPDDLGSNDPSPSIIVKEEECKTNPPHIVATIVYKMCNLNDEVFVPNEEATFLKYKEMDTAKVNNGNSIINVDGWDDEIDAYSYESRSFCRSYVEERTLNPCENEFTAMVVSMDGILRKNTPNYCRCFLKQFSRSKVIPHVPQKSDCEIFFKKFEDFIPFLPPATEAYRVRRIGIETTCQDLNSKSIAVVNWRGDGTKSEVDLSDLIIPQNGMITICPRRKEGCDVVYPELFIGYGQSSFGLVENKCDDSRCCQEELDIYGARNKSLYLTSFRGFSGCSAVRTKEYTRENRSDPDSWKLLCP